MGMFSFYGPTRPKEEIVELIRYVMEQLGVTLLDTSDTYGPFTNKVLISKVQPLWLEEILESPDHGNMATVNKMGLHRRASSDSMAFLESFYNSDIMAGCFAAEEERYSAQGGAPPSVHTLRIEIPDYNG
ncbi:unnamed protein product [Sphagnum troendelagicum]